jgi:hypothetical protein
MGKLKSFADFNKIVKDVYQNNAKNYQQDFTTEMGGEIAKLTPVDTGRATANWTGSINEPNVTPKIVTDQSFSAQPTKQRIQIAVGSSKYGDDLYLANGVQGQNDNGSLTGDGYIIQLEQGKSKKAPNGMVEINLARAKVISERALKK